MYVTNLGKIIKLDLTDYNHFKRMPIVLTELTTSSQVLAKSGTNKFVAFTNQQNVGNKWL